VDGFSRTLWETTKLVVKAVDYLIRAHIELFVLAPINGAAELFGKDPIFGTPKLDQITGAVASGPGGSVLDERSGKHRDLANRAQLRALLESPSDGRGRGDQAMRDRAQTLLAQLEEGDRAANAWRHHLLSFDLTGDGRAVVAVGDPSTADHVAVFVPGAGTNIDNVGMDLQRMENLQQRADERTPGKDGDVAVVMWLGYDAPGDYATALGSAHAEEGAPRLNAFIDELRASSRRARQRLTVIGYSYGSVVVGTAARRGKGLPVDDIVVLGSPGMGVEDAEQLRIDPSHVWAGAADGDHVAGWVGELAHNVDPHEQRFGANRFEVDTQGHEGYWDTGSESPENQAAIIVGQYTGVSLEHRASR
jgi:hypothetical protein